MKPVTEYRQVSAKIMAALKPGRLCNLVLSKNSYLSEIEGKTLFYHEFAQGLLLFRRRDGFWRMQYSIDPQCSLPPLPEGVVVAEQAFRSSENPCVPAVFAKAGFTLALQRVRLSREPGNCPVAPPPELAKEADVPAIDRLLARCFDRSTGCLPTDAELTDAIIGGRVFCTRFPDGSPSGVLHTEQGRTALEIRHLAVDEPARGQGVGSALLAGMLAREGEKKITVFTGADNTAALALYQKCGFVPDGTSSLVVWKGSEWKN